MATSSQKRYPENVLVDIKTFFEKEREVVERRLRQINEEDPYSNPDHATSNADTLEDASEDIQHQQAEAQKDTLQKKLSEINEALSRVEKGTYGFCKKCDALIDTDRLSSNPFTLYCISCASK